MISIMETLYNYICENTTSLRNDPEYRQAVKVYTEIEEEVKEKIGDDLLDRYKCAERAVSHQWEVSLILQTLRSGHQFMLEILR